MGWRSTQFANVGFRCRYDIFSYLFADNVSLVSSTCGPIKLSLRYGYYISRVALNKDCCLWPYVVVRLIKVTHQPIVGTGRLNKYMFLFQCLFWYSSINIDLISSFCVCWGAATNSMSSKTILKPILIFFIIFLHAIQLV